MGEGNRTHLYCLHTDIESETEQQYFILKVKVYKTWIYLCFCSSLNAVALAMIALSPVEWHTVLRNMGITYEVFLQYWLQSEQLFV